MGRLRNYFLNHYPRTDFHELNQDWMISMLFDMINQVENFVEMNSVKYADPIQWSITSQYEKNTIVVDPITGTAYLSNKPVPIGVALSRTEFWSVIFDLGRFITLASQNFANSYEAVLTTTATMPTDEDKWVVWNSILYRAKNDIHVGDRYVVDGNIEKYTVEMFFDELAHLISEETDARIEADNVLHGEIVDESVARENADTTLQDNIDAEATARENADDTLQDNIDAEATARENADDVLQDNIDAEATARENADDELRRLIEAGVSYYSNLSQFKSDLSVVANRTYLVTGYYSSGDCEIMIYQTTGTATGAYKEIVLDNGVCAHLVKSNDAYFNVKQYGAYGDGLHNDYNILNDIINHARTLENAIVYLPDGEYIIDIYLEALRTNSVTNVPRDFHNMTLCGDGATTIIHGKSDTDKFDILQINEGCNLNIRDLALTETSNANVTWGVNGISLTNGCHDITIENVHVFDLPYYVGGGYVDGGKAFTVQTGGVNTIDVTNIQISNCSCKNAPMGFEFDAPANNIKYQVTVRECDFDTTYTGIVISFPNFGTNTYSTSATFSFEGCNIRSQQKCVNCSRGSNIYFTNCTFEQYGTPSYILSGDTDINSFITYASRLITIDTCIFLSTFGDNAIKVLADGYTASRNIIIKNVFVGNSFTGAGIDVGNSPTSDMYVDNLNNVGASTSFTAAARQAMNTVLNYGGYQIFNNYTMTDKASGKTLGSYTGNAIPIYNSIGSLVGWLPLYN